MTVVSILRLRVREHAGSELERKFDELEIFERSRKSCGFRGGRLLRSLSADRAYLVMAEWDDADAYQGWLDNPVRAELGQQLEPLIDGEVASGELFEEV